jgi:hypothetical protein
MRDGARASVVGTKATGRYSSCGAFVRAYATSIVFGQNSGLIEYDKNEMRQHIYKCIEKQSLETFPSKKLQREWKMKNSLQRGLHGRRVLQVVNVNIKEELAKEEAMLKRKNWPSNKQ